MPPDGPQLDTLNPAEIKAKLSNKVQKLFRDKSPINVARSPPTANVKIFESDVLSSDEAENNTFVNYLKEASPKASPQRSPPKSQPRHKVDVVVTEKPSREDYYRNLHAKCNCTPQDVSATVQLQHERDMLKITVEHLESELNVKQSLINRQNSEIECLRDSVL